MKLTDLKNEVDRFIGRKKKGKKLKSAQIQHILEKLQTKEKKVMKEYANQRDSKDGSTKNIKKLELQKKVLKAQMKKAHKLLDDLN